MRYRSKGAALIVALRAVQAALGGAGGFFALAGTLTTLAALSWFADALYRLWFEARPAWWGLVPFLALLALVFLATGLVRRLPRPAPVIEERLARPARALVLFLSPTRAQLPPEPERVRPEHIPANDSWAMPLVALRKHFDAGTLEWVVVISSAGQGDDRDPRKRGTWHLLEDFRRVVADLVGLPKERILTPPRFRYGANFESAAELWEALDAALALLHAQGVRTGIVIDVTGGTKLPAVVSGVAGLGEGVRLEYVSTVDKRVFEYDIRMRIHP